MRVRGEISESVKDYLIVSETQYISTIPPTDIHKNVSPLERVSAFVNHFLALIVRTSRSYIQDTSDFLRKLRDLKDIPSEASLVTLDMCSLYTNIPNLEGLNAAYDALGS